MSHCRYHCRRCESHFTSLEGFDAHHGEEPCTFPEDLLVETTGSCLIGNPAEPARGVVVYRLVREGKYGAAGRETARGRRKHPRVAEVVAIA